MCCIDLTESRLEVRRRMGVGKLPLREEVDLVRERERDSMVSWMSCRCRQS